MNMKRLSFIEILKALNTRKFYASLLAILAILYFGCRSRPDVSPFITKESHFKAIDDCQSSGSKDSHCSTKIPLEKAYEYCKSKSLSASDCSAIEGAIYEKAIEYDNLKTEELRKMIIKTREVMDKIKREHGQ